MWRQRQRQVRRQMRHVKCDAKCDIGVKSASRDLKVFQIEGGGWPPVYFSSCLTILPLLVPLLRVCFICQLITLPTSPLSAWQVLLNIVSWRNQREKITRSRWQIGNTIEKSTLHVKDTDHMEIPCYVTKKDLIIQVNAAENSIIALFENG